MSKVTNIQLHRLANMSIFNTKIVPVSMTSRVRIDPKEKIVFQRVNFDGAIKISVFEDTIKGKFRLGESWVHPFKSPVEKGGAIMVVVSESLLTTLRSTFI